MSKIYHTGMVHYAAQADRYEWPCTGAELPPRAALPVY